MRYWNRFRYICTRSQRWRLSSSGARAFSPFPSAPSVRRLTTSHKSDQAQVLPKRHIYEDANPFTKPSEGDTIYALSTAPGRAAIAVIRISGTSALKVYRALCPSKPAAPTPRYATLRTLYNPSPSDDDDKLLDPSALVFYFPAPETATGEDILELHVHGGTAIVKAVLAAIPNSLPEVEGIKTPIRYAEPGEFTRRAFYNNRLDILQVEALANTLSAETEQQRRLALRSSRGSLADRYEAWRQKLLHARGELEALIDFSEDQHFEESPAQLCNSVARQVEDLVGQLRANIESAAKGELLRNGINVALVGAPNAGKSSLFNCIVGRDAAIVSEEAGTTRDVVEVSVDIGGYLCRFGDVAGLRNVGTKPNQPSEGGDKAGLSVSAIEQEGMRRARERALAADVVIVICSKFRNGARGETRWVAELEPEISEVLQQLDPKTQKVVCVLNKVDLLGSGRNKRKEPCHALARHPSLKPLLKASKMPLVYPISCNDAELPYTPEDPDPGGIQKFLDGLTRLFHDMTSPVAPESHTDGAAWAAESLGATERQRLLLSHCLRHLGKFLREVQPDKRRSDGEEIDIVLAAESLRAAADCLARITGKGEVGDVEEVLGVVFEK